MTRIDASNLVNNSFNFSAIPQLDGYVMNKTGVQSIAADPWQRVQVSQSDQQQLAPIASEFAIAVGLAQRSNIS
jgi:type IV pilus assembly protein PilM